ncbi:MAG TPA: dihydrofolate reductase family protein [Phototrophicaceae bacterium]|jgi:dihydrofolate reductase|nr:dihydrofolate reductase family protein [Phototrophicaceae bacterium]
MSKVFLQISMSLDGFVAAPNISPEHPLGVGGVERLHRWLFDGMTEIDRQVADEMFADTGAFVIGRLTFDLGEEPWGDDGTFRTPCFVVTHRARSPLVKGPTTFNFVTDGIESAVHQAKVAAGDKDVCVMGGANVAQQALSANLVDELRLDVIPVLLGAGSPLFEHIKTVPVELEQTRVLKSTFATHFRFNIVR